MYIKYGDNSSQVLEIQNLLESLGFKITKDGVFGKQSQAAVIDFQNKMDLYSDGIVGDITYEALVKAAKNVNIQSASKMKLKTIQCDKYSSGYSKITLREDTSDSIEAIRVRLNQSGAILTSSGGLRELSALSNSNRSMTSFHYCGLANDLYIYSGMVNPLTDPYVVTKSERDGYWTVFARANDGDELSLKGYTYNHKIVDVNGKFLNLTQIFNESGWKEIPARPSFFNNGKSALAAEWWHFQYESPLKEGQSTFGEELLKIYNQNKLEKTSLWKYKDYIFGKGWK